MDDIHRNVFKVPRITCPKDKNILTGKFTQPRAPRRITKLMRTLGKLGAHNYKRSSFDCPKELYQNIIRQNTVRIT